MTAVLCPFDLTVDVINRMLNFEIADDPVYTGLEMQAFDDDSEYGRGVLAFLTRRDDGRAYVYRQPGLRLDPREFQVGRGLGGWVEATLDPARLDITDHGVDAALRFRDDAGHDIEVRIDDRGRRRRRPARLLAPFGAEVEDPTSLLLAYMRRFDLLHRPGREFRILIDGREVRTGSLPGGWLLRRRLVKYAADIVVVRLNQAEDGPLTALDPLARAVEFDDRSGIAGVTAARGGHRARLDLCPALPDLSGLEPGAGASGAWDLSVDELRIEGTWSARRSDKRVDLVMDVTLGVAADRAAAAHAGDDVGGADVPYLAYHVPLGGEHNPRSRPSMSSRWERTGGDRGCSFCTRSADAFHRLALRRSGLWSLARCSHEDRVESSLRGSKGSARELRGLFCVSTCRTCT